MEWCGVVWCIVVRYFERGKRGREKEREGEREQFGWPFYAAVVFKKKKKIKNKI